MDDRTLGRGAFLGTVGLGLAGLLYGRTFTDAIGRIVPNSVQSIVPTGGWRIYTVSNGLPNVDPEAYRLTLNGEVGKPVSYTLGDLRRMQLETQVSDFHCVTGWSVKNVTWHGIRLRKLFQEAGLKPSAKALRFVSIENPYDDALTLDQAFLPDVMVALDMNGKPVSRAHGGPVRLVIPDMYGYKSVKWLGQIEAISNANYRGYWEQRGYDTDAWLGRSNGYTS